MSNVDYIRFLVATTDDVDLRRALRRDSVRLVTPADLVAFAERHGYRFNETDIPVSAARAAG